MIFNPSKILVVHTWGIGDLVMLTPALGLLRKNFPQAKIDLFVSQAVVGEVLQENRTINEILRLDRKKEGFFSKLKFIYQLRKRKYDLALVSTGVNPFLASLFVFLIGAKFRVGEYRQFRMPLYTHQIKANEKRHKIYSNLDLLRAVGLKMKKTPQTFFEFREEDKEFAQDFIRKIGGENKILIGFHPGAGKQQQFKVWSKNNFIELGRKILENNKNAYIILFGGPREKEPCQEIKDKIGGDTFLATTLTLKQVAALIDNCRVFISSDSGLGHIASTTKTILISIFGPTEPERTAPSGERVHIVKEECSYPYNDLGTLKYDAKRIHGCLEKITPEAVFNEIEKILERKDA